LRVVWDDNLATIHWREDLADPKASKDETPFTIMNRTRRD